MTDQKNWKEVAEGRLDAKRGETEAVPFAVNEDGTPAAASIKTKSAAMSGILSAISSMSHEDMMKWVTDAVQMTGLSTAAANAATLKMKPSAASAVKEDAAAIFGDELNEEQLGRVLTLIENAVDTRVAVARASVEEQFVELFAESMDAEVASLSEKVDQYITYAAEQWVEKNEVAIESAVRLERADRMIEGIRALMGEVGVALPEETVDVVAEMTSKAEALQAKLDEAIADSIALTEKVEELEAHEVFREVAEGLALTEAEKFKTLIEDVEIGGDREELKKKLEIIRDAHFKKESAPANTGINEQVDGEEVPAQKQPTVAPVAKDMRIDRLADAISRASTSRYTGIRS